MQQVRWLALGGLSLVLFKVFKIFFPELINSRFYHRKKKVKAQNQHTSAHTKPTHHNKQFNKNTQEVQITNLLLLKVATKTLSKF
jgi:hypothetical protein